MKSEELHFEVIRDKKAIRAELEHSLTTGRRLAICFRAEDKLIVKIALVTAIDAKHLQETVTFRADADDAGSEYTVLLHTIESIYPMHSYMK